MALSKEESTRETTNLACISQIILGPCTAVLQDVLAEEMLPINLQEQFESFLDKRHIRLDMPRKAQRKQIFSKIKENPHFNIPLLYACLRCICSIPPHKNKWGNFPDEQDRSLSANIERIYSLHKEYVHYPNYHLKDLIFEHAWKNAHETVKELEENLGSDTKHQKTIKELKNCSMTPRVGKQIIERLWGSKSGLANFILDSEKRLGGRHVSYIYIGTEAVEPFMMESESESEAVSESKENDKTGILS